VPYQEYHQGHIPYFFNYCAAALTGCFNSSLAPASDVISILKIFTPLLFLWLLIDQSGQEDF
jgi:hypothetical protein